MRNKKKLKETILNYINLKKEGLNWDFKKEYGSSNSELVKDIICLANSVYFGDKYLIFGVDEKQDYKVCDVRNNKNRKTLEKITDLLLGYNFVNGVIPKIDLDTISIENKSIDVITIKNISLEKPYYLIRKPNKSDLREFNVYSRINTNNTPTNKSIFSRDLEMIWKERFGFFNNPYDRFLEKLKEPLNWSNNPISGEVFHNKYCYNLIDSDFRIETISYSEDYLIFGAYFLSPIHHLVTANLVFKGKPIKEFRYYMADEFSSIIGLPKIQSINHNSNLRKYYYYYLLNDFDGIFHYFCNKGDLEFNNYRSSNYFLYFKDEAEKELFDNEHRSKFEKYFKNEKNKHITSLQLERYDLSPNWSKNEMSKYTSLLKKFFDDWRVENPLLLDY